MCVCVVERSGFFFPYEYKNNYYNMLKKKKRKEKYIFNGKILNLKQQLLYHWSVLTQVRRVDLKILSTTITRSK